MTSAEIFTDATSLELQRAFESAHPRVVYYGISPDLGRLAVLSGVGRGAEGVMVTSVLRATLDPDDTNVYRDQCSYIDPARRRYGNAREGEEHGYFIPVDGHGGAVRQGDLYLPDPSNEPPAMPHMDGIVYSRADFTGTTSRGPDTIVNLPG